MSSSERSVGPRDVARALGRRSFSLQAVLAEFAGMTLFVFTGCATAVFFSSSRVSTFANSASDQSIADANFTLAAASSNILKALDVQTQLLTVNASWGIITALAFGMAIMALAYSIGHVSGCHLNAAVTISLMLSGNCSLIQGVANICAQLCGSLLAAGYLYGMVPDPSSSSLGANAVSPSFDPAEAVMGEAAMTCFLCYVVHMTAVDLRSVGNKGFAPLAIGFTVFLGHAVLLAVDGCSINPTRSFGPAAVSGTWANFWVFVVGPIAGAIVSVPLWWLSTQPAISRISWDDGVDRPPKEFGAGRAVPSAGNLVDGGDSPQKVDDAV